MIIRVGAFLFFCFSFLVSPRGKPVSKQTTKSKSDIRGVEARALGKRVRRGKVLQRRGKRSL